MYSRTYYLLNVLVFVDKVQVKRKKQQIKSKEIRDFEKTWIHNIWILGWFIREAK